MDSVEIINHLAATSARTDKERIIRDAFLAGSPEFFIGARLALDPLVTFNIAKVAEIFDEDDAAGDFSFTDFLDLAHRLRRRQLTGHGARDAIHTAAARCHIPTWNLFYRRILLKDLKVGVEAKTLNKALSLLPGSNEYLIPLFGCQLAHNGDSAIHQKKMCGRKLVDMKLDGVRALAVIDKEANIITLFSRTGSVIEHFLEVYGGLVGLLSRVPGSVVLDGELISPQGFEHLMMLLGCKENHPDMAKIRYALFDIIPLNEFRAGHSVKSQRERHALLEVMQQSGMWTETNGRVWVIPQIEVDLDTPDGQAALSEFNRRVLDHGYEGIMLKDPDAGYTCKRTTAWLKRKPFIEVTLPIVGFEIGDPDGKYKNTLGAVVCHGVDEDKLITTNVSSGIDDSLRDEIWHNQQRYRGLMVEIRADRFTVTEGSSYSLRFPRWKGLRGRSPMEKL